MRQVECVRVCDQRTRDAHRIFVLIKSTIHKNYRFDFKQKPSHTHTRQVRWHRGIFDLIEQHFIGRVREDTIIFIFITRGVCQMPLQIDSFSFLFAGANPNKLNLNFTVEILAICNCCA